MKAPEAGQKPRHRYTIPAKPRFTAATVGSMPVLSFWNASAIATQTSTAVATGNAGQRAKTARLNGRI